jgi:hypothetical protein
MNYVKQLKAYAATNLASPPAYRAANEVKLCGEKLTRPISWTGYQWAVTGYGLECRDGCYHVAKHDLWMDECHHGWVPHMSEKGWVDLDDFAEALRIARHMHRAKDAPPLVPQAVSEARTQDTRAQ